MTGSGQVISGFSGVARKFVKVSEIAEMPWEIAQEASGNCSGSLGKSWEVLRTFLRLVSNVLRVLWDVTSVKTTEFPQVLGCPAQNKDYLLLEFPTQEENL